MMPAVRTPHLLDRLPPMAGRVQADAPLAPSTWFRVGGPAEALVRPSSAPDLQQFMAALPHDVAVTVLGAASNVIVRDGGIHGVVLRLGRGFGEVRVEPDGVIAGAACLDASVAEHAAAAGLAAMPASRADAAAALPAIRVSSAMNARRSMPSCV